MNVNFVEGALLTQFVRALYFITHFYYQNSRDLGNKSSTKDFLQWSRVNFTVCVKHRQNANEMKKFNHELNTIKHVWKDLSSITSHSMTRSRLLIEANWWDWIESNPLVHLWLFFVLCVESREKSPLDSTLNVIRAKLIIFYEHAQDMFANISLSS
jgi:hypothetical protein